MHWPASSRAWSSSPCCQWNFLRALAGTPRARRYGRRDRRAPFCFFTATRIHGPRPSIDNTSMLSACRPPAARSAYSHPRMSLETGAKAPAARTPFRFDFAPSSVPTNTKPYRASRAGSVLTTRKTDFVTQSDHSLFEISLCCLLLTSTRRRSPSSAKFNWACSSGTSSSAAYWPSLAFGPDLGPRKSYDCGKGTPAERILPWLSYNTLIFMLVSPLGLTSVMWHSQRIRIYSARR